MAANTSSAFCLRSILDKEKLSGNNFPNRYRNLRIVLTQEKELYVLGQPLPAPPPDNATRAERDAYRKHQDDAVSVGCLMLATMDPELQKQHEHMGAGESYQHDACHGFLLLIFGTILFPHSSNLIDEALAQVILQVVFRPSDCDYTGWIQFFKRLTRAQFLWAACWNPGARVIKQLGGLKDIPIEADHTSHRSVWTDITALLPDRVLRIREVRRLWGTRTVQELYFPEHPTDDERAFSATVAYVAQFHPQGLTPRASERAGSDSRTHSEPRQGDSVFERYVGPSAGYSANADTFSNTTDANYITYNTYGHIHSAFRYPYRTSSTNSTGSVQFVNPACFTALEGMVNHLATNMATNMTELMVKLRNQNQASSSFTPPSEHRPIVDPNPTVPPTFVSEVEDTSFSAMAFAPTVHPISDSLPPPPALTAVPLPPAAFLSADSTMHTLPPLTVSMHPPIYTVPPPTVPPVVLAQAPALTADHFPFQAPQPQTSFPYQAPPPLNIPPLEPGTPTQAAPPALPTNIPSENEQERRMKRMEETIRALQAGTSRLDFGDSDWNLFPGMLLPPKIKIPDFKRYDGTTDPRHHLRHYHSKMLSYWDYEEFVIKTFQDSLMGSALLKHMHIPCIMCSPTSHSRPIHRPRQLLSSHNLRNSTLLLRLNKEDLRLRDLLSRLNVRRPRELNKAILLNCVRASSTPIFQLLHLTYSSNSS
ncbi:hypothetical protein CRG98_012339 [Punica granatum]|uniref:Uncharacterized protein n=1 Tax=Punica granatum TaxID=22663 RepID=A0A2I0KFK6_PUNGR|nr:hypothetical protein CRG98_012339 [Punica granatum]